MRLNNLIKNNKLSKSGIFYLAIPLLLFLSQFMFAISIGSRNIYVYFVEIPLMFLVLLIFLEAIKNKGYFIKNKKTLTLLTLLIFWFMILCGYRYIRFGDLTGTFIIFRVLVLPIFLYLFLKKILITKKDIVYGIMIFTLMLSIYQVFDLVFLEKSFRSLKGLANINIYIAYSCAVLPIIIEQLSLDLKTFQKFLFTICLVISTIICLFSGSRAAFILCPLIVLVSFINNFGINKKGLKVLIGFFVIDAVIISTFYVFDFYDSKNNFNRSVSPIVEAINIKIIEPIIKETNSNNEVISTVYDKEFANNITKLESNSSKKISREVININDSNIMRIALWNKSIEYIKKDPIFGKTNIDIEIDMKFSENENSIKYIQSPHNFILEIWLAFGLPGMILYFALFFSEVFYILKINIDKKHKINLIIVLFSIFSYSFFQPLITCYFAISLLAWIVITLYNKEANKL